MPATGIKCDMQFNADGLAVTETHVAVSQSTIAGALPIFQNLYKLRYMIMGANVLPAYGRLSTIGIFRSTQTLDRTFLEGLPAPPANVQYNNNGQGVTLDNNPEETKAAINLKMIVSDTIKGRVFLAGIPDLVFSTFPDGPNLAGVGSWAKLFNKYIAELTSGRWGMVARTAEVQTNIFGWTTNPTTGNAVAIIQGALAVTPGVSKVQIRGVKRTNKAYQPVNGTWLVANYTSGPGAGQNQIELFGSQSIQTNTFLSTGSVVLVDYTTYAYTGYTLVGQTTRKRGNRQLAALGRRKVTKYL